MSMRPLRYEVLKEAVEQAVAGIEKAAQEGDKKGVSRGTLKFTKLLGSSPGILSLDELNRYSERFRVATDQEVYR